MTVSWYKDDTEIIAGAKYQTDFTESTATLGITQLQKSDAGIYTCRAKNAAGSGETSGTLSVKGLNKNKTIYFCFWNYFLIIAHNRMFLYMFIFMLNWTETPY